jgi:hypothetical protein
MSRVRACNLLSAQGLRRYAAGFWIGTAEKASEIYCIRTIAYNEMGNQERVFWSELARRAFLWGAYAVLLPCAVEQRLARQAHNLEVVGSIPTGAIAIEYKFRSIQSLGHLEIFFALCEFLFDFQFEWFDVDSRALIDGLWNDCEWFGRVVGLGRKLSQSFSRY